MTDSEINEKVAVKLGREYLLKKSCDPSDPYSLRSNIPDFCNRIEAAWDIVPKLGQFKLEYWDLRNLWRITKIQWRQDDVAIAEADTAARAICEAFLKLP